MADQEEHNHNTTRTVATDGREKEQLQPSLLGKLQQQSDTSSSSSSDEEVGGRGGEKRKKKKGLTEMLKEKIYTENEDNSIPIEKVEVTFEDVSSDHEEKKGFFERIIAKLPGSHSKKAKDGSIAEADYSAESEGEKKGGAV